MILKEFQSNDVTEETISDFVDDFDHHSEFFRDNYYNVIKYLTEKSPIFRSPVYGGFGVVSSYAAMRSIATDPATFPNANRSRVVPAGPLPPLLPVDINPPEHTFYRRVLNPLFSPGAMARRKAEVYDLAREILAQLKARDSFDIIEDYAKPLTGTWVYDRQ